jgi:hypothetical protein
MEQTIEQRIRERAYEIWNAVGRPDGQADELWFAAEREVLAAPALPPKAAVKRGSRSRKRAGGRAGA